jgi:hypothetical protein
MSLLLIIEATRLLWGRFLAEHAEMAAKVECFLEEIPWRDRT